MAIVLLVFYHVLVSGFYLNSAWKIGLMAAAGLVVLASYARDSYQLDTNSSRVRDSASYSHLISYGAALLACLYCLVLAALYSSQ